MWLMANAVCLSLSFIEKLRDDPFTRDGLILEKARKLLFSRRFLPVWVFMNKGFIKLAKVGCLPDLSSTLKII
jgi:hypothetical protein